MPAEDCRFGEARINSNQVRTTVAILWTTAVLSAAAPIDTSAHTLSNGMRIVIHEDHDIPNVAMYMFFRVGSRNERPGISGISHFLEHMMFDGTKGLGSDQFDQRMESRGGSNNAYTTRDVTVYTDWFPSSETEDIVSMEADRLVNLTFQPAVVESERRVVWSERELTVENDNDGYLDELLYPVLYRRHPYRLPILGLPADIRAWNMEDLARHYQMGYAPNNCVLVVVGDVDTGDFLKLARKYLEPIARRELPPPVDLHEPEQTAERRLAVERHSETGMKVAAYHVPPSAHQDHWPLELLGEVLAGGQTARLHQRLVVRDKLAMSVEFWKRLSLDPGEMVLELKTSKSADLAECERVLLEELDRMREQPVSAEELKRAKAQLRLRLARAMQDERRPCRPAGNLRVFLAITVSCSRLPLKSPASLPLTCNASRLRICARRIAPWQPWFRETPRSSLLKEAE